MWANFTREDFNRNVWPKWPYNILCAAYDMLHNLFKTDHGIYKQSYHMEQLDWCTRTIKRKCISYFEFEEEFMVLVNSRMALSANSVMTVRLLKWEPVFQYKKPLWFRNKPQNQARSIRTSLWFLSKIYPAKAYNIDILTARTFHDLFESPAFFYHDHW